MKPIALFVFICLIGFSAFAQTSQSGSTSKDPSTLELGVNYSSNSGIYGIFNSVSAQPVTSADFNYYGGKGLMLGISGQLIGNSNSTTITKPSTEMDLTGGWNLNVFENALSINPSYSHFFISAGAATAKSMFSDQAELDLSGSFKWFKPSITTDYLFGTRQALNLNFSLGFEARATNFLAEGNTLILNPSIGVNYGNLSWSYLVPKNLMQFLTPLRITYGDNLTIQQLLAKGTTVVKKATAKQLAILNPLSTLGEIFTATSGYQVNSLELSFPFTYTINKLSITTEFALSVPRNVPVYIKSQTLFLFSAGINYTFER